MNTSITLVIVLIASISQLSHAFSSIPGRFNKGDWKLNLTTIGCNLTTMSITYWSSFKKNAVSLIRQQHGVRSMTAVLDVLAGESVDLPSPPPWHGYTELDVSSLHGIHRDVVGKPAELCFHQPILPIQISSLHIQYYSSSCGDQAGYVQGVHHRQGGWQCSGWDQAHIQDCWGDRWLQE